MHRDVAVIDRGSDCRHVLVNVAAGAEELLVIAPTWSLPAWSGSIPFAIASSLLTAASSLASGRSSLYFMECAPPQPSGSALADRKSVQECALAAGGLAIEGGFQLPDRRVRRMSESA